MTEPNVNPMFLGLIASLQQSGWAHLGKVTHPATGKIERNIAAAKETIELLGMLEEKTKGNLTDDEQKFMTAILTELRMNYVAEVDKDKKAASAPKPDEASEGGDAESDTTPAESDKPTDAG